MHFIPRFIAVSIAAGLLFCGVALAPFAHADSNTSADAIDNSDLNRDGVVDLADLEIFSVKYLGQDQSMVDWCAFYETVATEDKFGSRPTEYYRKHFRLLLGFIYDEFNCDGAAPLLPVVNDPRSLTRAAVDALDTGNFYISDPRVGSVFIYDPNRVLIGELRNLDKPLGVAIDSQGYLLVGSDKWGNIQVYDPANGDLLATFGDGMVQMPTSITIGPAGEIYVTDSRAHQVRVFESSYVHVRTIGEPGRGDGQLKFPSDTVVLSRDTVAGTVDEVYVADQGNKRIQVFDTQGNFLRTITPPTPSPGVCFSCPADLRGTFNRLQALDADAAGRLHVLDVFEAAVSLIDPLTGALGESYGGYGDGTGLLHTPLDVLLTGTGDALVTDSDSGDIEMFAVP